MPRRVAGLCTWLLLVAAPAVMDVQPASAEPPETGKDRADEQPVYLKGWEIVEVDEIRFLKITGSNGVEAAIPVRGGYADRLRQAEAVMKRHDLFDHVGLYEALREAGVAGGELRAADVLAWDLHARSRSVPLHALIGTRQTSVLRYADIRWRKGSHDARSYAKTVADNPLKVAKLHFPGHGPAPQWAGSDDGFTVDQIISYLKQVREASPDKILAYDPHPQRAAATNLADARRIMQACDEYDIDWIEAPLPDTPEFWPQYRTLRREFDTLIQNEEANLSYEAFVDWMDAGALDVVCPTPYVHTGLGMTPVVRIIRWIQDHPDRAPRLNLHYPGAEHTQLAFTLTEKQLPYFEAPWSSSQLARHYQSANLYGKAVGPNGTALAPTWPGIYDIAWLNQ